jgi:AcrR family transcriptional regulator
MTPRDEVRRAVLDAATTLLNEGGSAALTTRAVAEAAGVQAPTIYRLFGDKDGLVDAVAEQVMARYVDTKDVGSDDADPVGALHQAWRSHIEFGLANPALYAVLGTPDRIASSPTTRRGQDVLRLRIRRVARAGRLRVPEERALRMIQAAGNGTVLTLLSTPPGERDPALAEAMWAALARAVLTTGGTGEAAPVRATAIALRSNLDALPGLTPAETALMREWLDRATRDG